MNHKFVTAAPVLAALLSAGPAHASRGGITLAAIGSFDSFNPFILAGTAPRGIYRLFQPLLRVSDFRAGVLEPAIATGMTLSDDGRRLVFTLNPKARFSTGARVTPQDVIWTFHILRTKGQPFFQGYYRGIVSIAADGPDRVVFRLAADAGASLPHDIATEPILPERFWRHRDFGKPLHTPPPGSGPYRVAAFRMGASVTYRHVKHWWGDTLADDRARYRLGRITVSYFRDAAVAFQAFKAGRVDLWVETDPSRWAHGYDFPALRAGRVQRAALPLAIPAGMHGFVFNLRHRPLRSRDLREALALTFDFPWMNRVLFDGFYARNTSFFANSPLAATADVPALPAGGADGHDDAALRHAITLLGRAGWHLRHFRMVNAAGHRLTLSVLIDDAAMQAPLLAWQAILARIGVRLRIDLVDAATFAARKASFRYDLIRADFPAPERPGAAEADYFGCASAEVPGSDNLAGLCDGHIDALVGRLAAAPDRQARIAAGRALDRALRRLWIVVPGWYAKTVHLAWWNHYVIPTRRPRLGYDIDLWAARQAPR